MTCCLVALDKRLGVKPIGIGEKLLHAITVTVMMAAGYQAKMAFEILQICAGIEAGIEGVTHHVMYRW